MRRVIEMNLFYKKLKIELIGILLINMLLKLFSFGVRIVVF